MINLSVDFDKKRNKAILTGDKFGEIREYFSVQNPAAKFNRSFYTQKRLYAIAPNGTFDIGMVGEIVSFLEEKNYTFNIKYSKEALAELNPKLEKPLIKRLSINLRDYQEDTVNRCLSVGRGVCVLGTGAGKTLTIASLIDNFYLYAKNTKSFKCLIIVPDLGLVNQTYTDFLEYNVSFSVTRWTGKLVPDFNANVIIANADILLSRFEDNHWIKDVDLLIIDEAHGIKKNNKSSKLIEKIKTPNKFGFTGTLPDDNLDKWNVLGKIGPVLIKKSSHELREDKFLTNVTVKVIKLDYTNNKPIKVKGSLDPTENYRNELQFLSYNTFRNKIIQTTCNNFRNNVLILLNNIDHGQHLYDLLLQNLKHKQVFFIRGEVEVEERDKVKEIMENNNNVVCIAISSIFSTGVNIKNLHMILFAAGGKSFIRTVQSIGRGLRLNENKDELVIIDIADKLEYGIEHSNKRKEIYNNEKIVYSEYTITET
jgi:superfamily II DNA or RNA helicase